MNANRPMGVSLASAVLAVVGLAACTQGEGLPVPGGSDFTNAAAQRCAPDNALARDSLGNLLTGYGSGTRTTEKNWVKSYLEDRYLWYREIPTDVDPAAAAYNTGTHTALMTAYFRALLTPSLTTSGVKKDQFSFVYPTVEYNQLSQSGIEVGYGVTWKRGADDPPRNIRVAFLQPGAQGAQVGLARGDVLVRATVDGRTVSADDPDPDAYAWLRREVLLPTTRGKAVVLEVLSATKVSKRVTVTTSETTSQPVLVANVLPIGGSQVGYLLVNDFVMPAESQMLNAIQQFRAQNVTELILDLRYNGGGYIYLASQLAYMIAGPSSTRGRIFDRLVYSDKRSSENTNTTFRTTTTGYSGSGTVVNTALPTLNLRRVYVLTGAATCSASEAVINGLRGVGITATLVGSKTCGKPYGFAQRDNCGLSYFPIEFQGVNDRGFGDYADGMEVDCAAADDFTRPLGDANEGMLAAALSHRVSGSCVAPKTTDAPAADTGSVVRQPFREGIFLAPEEGR